MPNPARARPWSWTALPDGAVRVATARLSAFSAAVGDASSWAPSSGSLSRSTT